MMYRNEKLKKSARLESCVACGADDGTITWAHSNSSAHGKAMGLKAHDLFGAYLCYTCHTNYDQSKDRDWARHMFKLWWEKSMLVACEKGYL